MLNPHRRRGMLLSHLSWLALLFTWVSAAALSGCGPAGAQPTPTLSALASIPENATATSIAMTQLPPPDNLPAEPNEAVAATPEPGSLIPTPEGIGLRPTQAYQQFVPDAGPAAPAEWRPPPYDVPLSLHPDDHYWMGRPLPSNRRNYDLPWYPFGNDVMIPALAPYRIHHGNDFPNEQGTSIMAVSSGTVIHAGPMPSPRNGVNYYGNTVVILHDWQWQGKDVYTLYAHTLELLVAEGDHVEKGQLIAGVGSSGEVTSSHLHLEVRVGRNDYAAARNPALWLAPYEGWGTLAGRFSDSRGRLITDADIQVIPVDVDTPVRTQRTYNRVVGSDEVWRENFVVGDLPAGRYTLLLSVNGITYRRDVTIHPGQTTFEIVSTRFEFMPTATPQPEAGQDADNSGENAADEGTATPTPES